MRFISKHVSQLMLERNVSSKELARLLELSPSSISSKLNNRTAWTTRDLVKLSEFFDVSLDDLVLGENVSLAPAQ